MTESTNLREVPKNREARIRRVHDLIYMSYSEMSEWARKGLKSRRYYAGNQWADMLTARQSKRIRMTHNVIRDDINKKVARLEEADLVMQTHGRGGEDFWLGPAWRDLLDWWRDWHGEFHDSAKEVHRKVWRDMHVVGEGFTWPVWDPDEEDGMGMVVLEYGCPFHTAWDSATSSVQLRDAFWVARFEPYDIDLLEQEFSQLKGKIQADVPRFFTQKYHQQAVADNYQSPMGIDAGAWSERMRKAYRIEFWEKRWTRTNVYLLDGRPARVRSPDGQLIQMTDEVYGKLPKAEQDQYEVNAVRDYKLWKSVYIGEHEAETGLSDYDVTQGGHGHFPVARYSANWSPDSTHGPGEVEPLMGYQDFINQSLSYAFESMFVGGSQLLWTTRGSMPQSEERKLDRLGESAVQRVRGYPGSQPPAFISSGGDAPAMYQGLAEYLTSLKDKASQITDVHRAAPKYDLSGKAIQELMAEADLSTVALKKGVESGLSQETRLVISLMQQNMRVNRLVRISGKADRDGYLLMLTNDKDRTIRSKSLERADEPDLYETPTGEKARVLSITDRDILKFDVRLELDTGKARTRAENMQIGSSFMQYLGPAASVEMLILLAELWEVPNLDKWVEALRASDSQGKTIQMIDQMQKESGLTVQEAFQMAGMMQQGAPEAAAPGGNGRAAVPV